LYSTFDGQPVDINSILVKYTYDGDANADGQINADDYAAIDTGFATHATGYRNGDFNYSGGQPNSDDYFTIDRAYSDQGAVLGEVPTAPQAPLAQETSVGAASAADPMMSTESPTPKRTKHRHHKRAPRLDPIWNPPIPNSDALTRFLRRF
ncbi:MAG TPA: hypothetical protein VGP94_10050, partial [Tepidisphaeraceae bacterium]|nr:hypothetical protein [Tepidisphaeraceae bacterium]